MHHRPSPFGRIVSLAERTGRMPNLHSPRWDVFYGTDHMTRSRVAGLALVPHGLRNHRFSVQWFADPKRAQEAMDLHEHEPQGISLRIRETSDGPLMVASGRLPRSFVKTRKALGHVSTLIQHSIEWNALSPLPQRFLYERVSLSDDLSSLATQTLRWRAAVLDRQEVGRICGHMVHNLSLGRVGHPTTR